MTTATATKGGLDEGTANAIRRALAAAQIGRLADACASIESALGSGGDPVALNALLGMLRTRLGDHQAAVESLEIAHQARPHDVRIAGNLVAALVKTGEIARALEIASAELAFADPTLQLARTRGFLALTLEQPEPAIEAYEHVIAGAPDDWESWNNLGNARLSGGDHERGIAAIERALAIAPDSPPPHLNLARAHRQAGNLEEAERLLRKMADHFPGDAKPLADLHDLLQLQQRDDEVLEVLDRALGREPDNVELLLARARHLGILLRIEEADAAFRAVLDREPTNPDAFAGLATAYEHTRADDLEALAGEAEDKAIEPNALNFVRAFAHRRAKRYAQGVSAIEQVAAEFEPAKRQHILGQMLEGMGDYDGAFAAFTRMNRIQSEDSSRPLERAAAVRMALARELEATTREWIDGWASSAPDPERRSPVFLVGFPRSGTTLLDTILMGHPDVAVMEERPVIARLEKEIGGFDAIAALDEAALRKAQKRYFEIAAEYADADSPVLVDKSPLLLNKAALIHRLFPDAQFILALRHPADVLLSCYVSNFNLNSSMANFQRLDTAVEFYDLNFRTWENAKALLPLQVHPIVYEQMVEDPPAILRPLVESLGLAWHDDMLDHTRTAAKRGVITTVSYAQVTQPIYTRSVDRWRNYRTHLEPILPVLEPWAEKFGYTI